MSKSQSHRKLDSGGIFLGACKQKTNYEKVVIVDSDSESEGSDSIMIGCPTTPLAKNGTSPAMSAESSGSDSDSSDLEIMDDASGQIRDQWEKAALTKSSKSVVWSEDVESCLNKIYSEYLCENKFDGSDFVNKVRGTPVNKEKCGVSGEEFVVDREKYKETDEYRHAAEEEWASRQHLLQIQAEEAQRLRKKRKAENSRLLEMEKRQKQRLDEIRESQKKDEELITVKEQIRVEVRRELEGMERRCKDMASVLRTLGVSVEGGRFPPLREVNAAYKQALRRFHPDRYARSGIREQVRAEETFKFISRLKEKCLPSSSA